VFRYETCGGGAPGAGLTCWGAASAMPAYDPPATCERETAGYEPFEAK
jgi:hypothetical protein